MTSFQVLRVLAISVAALIAWLPDPVAAFSCNGYCCASACQDGTFTCSPSSDPTQAKEHCASIGSRWSGECKLVGACNDKRVTAVTTSTLSENQKASANRVRENGVVNPSTRTDLKSRF